MTAPARLPPRVLRARLDVVLSPSAGLEGGDAFDRWVSVEPPGDELLGKRLLEAVVQALGKDGAWLAAAVLSHTFRESLTEARDGLA